MDGNNSLLKRKIVVASSVDSDYEDSPYSIPRGHETHEVTFIF